MYFISKYRLAIWLIVIAFLLALRIANLHLLGLFDYDAISNFHIIAELSKGNFARFYHHVSPFFYLTWLPLHTLFPDFVPLQYFFALLNIIALCFLVIFFSNRLQLPFHYQILIVLLAGSSMLYAASARYFSIDSYSLIFLYSAFIAFYHCREITRWNNHYWLIGWLSIGTSVAINYKHVYFVVFFIGYFLWKWRKQIEIKHILSMILAIGAIPLLMIFFGMLHGHHVLSYPKYFFAQVFIREINPYTDVPSFNFDFWFYPLYIIFFEPSILLFLLLFVFILIKYKAKLIAIFREQPILLFLALFCFPYLFSMAFLQKAPRGLLPIQIPLLLFLFYLCFRCLPKKLVIILSFLLITFQVILFYGTFYIEEQNGYRKMAAYIQRNKIDKIVITSGKGILPYLPDSTTYQIIFHEKEIKQLKASGFTYLLIDTFYMVAHPENFNSIKAQNPLIAVKEGTLLNKMVFLEHAEYTGLGFWQTINNFEKMSKLKEQLYLVKL